MFVCFAAATILSVPGCGNQVPGHPPAARIVITPSYVRASDGYQTDVVLDGTHSSDDVDDPKRLQPLLYQWEIEDRDAPVSPSSESPVVTVRIAGVRPVTVRLTVADGDNVKNTVSAEIGLTL
jgi:hypothetical protein